MSTLRKLAGETVIYGISHILPRILQFIILTPYLTNRLKDPSDYGIYSEFYSYTALILAFMTFRMDTAYFRYANGKDKAERDQVYSTTFVPMMFNSILVFLILMLFAGPIASWLQYPGQDHYVKYFAWILIFDAATTLVYSKFRLDGRPYRFLFYRFLNVISSVAFLLFFLEIMPRFMPGLKENMDQFLGDGKDLDYVFFSNVVASGLVFIGMIPELLKVKFSFDKMRLPVILKYTWPLTVVALAGNINQAFAAPLQKWLLAGNVKDVMGEVGIYAAAAKLAILLNLFTTAYNYAAEPFFFNNSSKDTERTMYGKASLAFTVVSCFAIIGIYLFIDYFLIIIGPNYRSGVYVVPFLLISYVFLGLYYNVSIWYKLSDNTKIGLWISLLGVGLTIGVSALLVPVIGVLGSALASVVCYLGMLVTSYYQGQRHYTIHYPVKQIFMLILTALLLMGVAYVIRDVLSMGLMWKTLFGLAGTALYLFIALKIIQPLFDLSVLLQKLRLGKW